MIVTFTAQAEAAIAGAGELARDRRMMAAIRKAFGASDPMRIRIPTLGEGVLVDRRRDLNERHVCPRRRHVDRGRVRGVNQ